MSMFTDTDSGLENIIVGKFRVHVTGTLNGVWMVSAMNVLEIYYVVYIYVCMQVGIYAKLLLWPYPIYKWINMGIVSLHPHDDTILISQQIRPLIGIRRIHAHLMPPKRHIPRET